jgi:hypothetical protein
MKRTWSIAAPALMAALFVSIPAAADLAPDPCMAKAVGDACTTPDNKPGTCKEDPNVSGLLKCEPTGASSSSSSTSGGAGGAGGASGEGGSEQEDEDDEKNGGCAFRGVPGAAGPAGMIGGGLAILAVGRLLSRRRRSR